MSGEDRVDSMAVKLAAYAQRAGADPAALVAAYQLSVGHRIVILRDIFHPDLLHPARTALILMLDAGCNDSVMLAAAALCESEFPALRVPAAEMLEALGPRVLELAEAVPTPDAAGDRLLEELVAAPDDIATIAIAERLDHARHLHFRDPSHWTAFRDQIRDVYLPLASRVSPALESRLAKATTWKTV